MLFCPQMRAKSLEPPISDLRAKSYYISEIYMIFPGAARICGQKRKYIIYMGSCRAIHSYIAASTLDLVRHRPSASDEPNPRSRGYIAVYSPPRPHIYITYIYMRTVQRYICPIHTGLLYDMRAIYTVIALELGYIRYLHSAV